MERVEPDALVSAAEIAKRSHLGRAAISLHAKGERGHDFPSPIVRVTSESPPYDWAEVAAWLYDYGLLPLVEVVQARTVREVNRYVMREQPDRSCLGRRLQAGRRGFRICRWQRDSVKTSSSAAVATMEWEKGDDSVGGPFIDRSSQTRSGGTGEVVLDRRPRDAERSADLTGTRHITGELDHVSDPSRRQLPPGRHPNLLA